MIFRITTNLNDGLADAPPVLIEINGHAADRVDEIVNDFDLLDGLADVVSFVGATVTVERVA